MKFEIGNTYRAFGRYDSYYDFKVTKRTNTFVTVQNAKGEEFKKKIMNWSKDEEIEIGELTLSASELAA